MVSPVIYGLQGLELSESERLFFTLANPFGYILFKRNIDTPQQLKALVASLKSLNKHAKVEILIDQEGGRVARLKPPHFGAYPSMEELITNTTDPKQAIEDNFLKLGLELATYGITINCAPVLDLRIEGADDIIGDRSFGSDPFVVASLAQAAITGLARAHVGSIIKHIPGHGRALVDSHLHLPIVKESLEVLAATDFAAFKLVAPYAKYAMTAHITYEAIDPDAPATLSKKVISYIREVIGFKGIIMTDDLSMKALDSSFRDRVHKSLRAGCNLILHCNGNMAEMQEIQAAILAY